jgi:GntR family transcriptional regulator, rspAB operon transcriptional repressor
MARRHLSEIGTRKGPRAQGSAEKIYLSLRSRILRIELRPGAALSETDLALQYMVSRTPVREALIRLADEGLVEILPKSGTNVSRIPLNLLPEAIVVRRALEEVTARHAALRATGSAILTLKARLMRQQEVAAQGDREAFFAADEAFHAAIADAAGYPGIWTLVERAKLQIDRYRRLTLPQEGRMARVIVEHAEVLDAIAAGNPEAAAAAMARHVEGLEISIADIRSMNPDYFEGDVIREGEAE